MLAGISPTFGRRGASRGLPEEQLPSRPDGTALAQCRPLAIPTTVVSEATRLFDLQMWCFGQDVSQLPGNGLLRAGFHRWPPPAVLSESASLYQRSISQACRLTLWSFGCLWEHLGQGGVFLERSFRVREIKGELLVRAWTAADLRFGSRSDPQPIAAQPMVLEFLRWLTVYERELSRRMGDGYRQDCLRRWGRPGTPDRPMSDSWQSVVVRLEEAWSPPNADDTQAGGATAGDRQ
ncbi:MAG: hypothetical protein R3B90_13810 [Planctomycetaceae bacterium]